MAPRSKTPKATDHFRARDKIKSVDELGVVAESLTEEGKTVVLCHGVFDLVHMGHVRHLEAARSEGDVLMVTVTADDFVNKGPGRPIFNDTMRAEVLAALEYVDWVAINHAPTAENVLDTIRPAIYVKGADYENADDDVTGMIDSERQRVEEHGGRLVFTKDITFSSSSLINRYLDLNDPPLRDYLEKLRDAGAAADILALIDGVKDYKALLVGETIIDDYQYVEAIGKPGKEPIIATCFKERELFAGGVIAAANHVASLCAEVEVITVLGADDSYEDIVRKSLKPNVKLIPIYREGVPTTRKCRFIDPGYLRKLFEVYFFDDMPLEPPLENALNDLLDEHAPRADVVIATDFGHGMIAASTIDTLNKKSRFLAVNTQTNSANQGYNLITRYAKADYICVDAPEARLAVADRFCSLEEVAAERLPARVNCAKIIITHGQHGCVTYEQGNGVVRIPAFTKTIVDTVGAGDAFLAITAPLAAAGGTMERVGFVGNAAGAMKVGIVGHRSSIERVPLIRYLTTLLK